jgi:Holliday junction resolvase RusA-like endonuclease
MRIEIKPLSVNDAWKGRRFRTDKYKDYQKEIALKLPNIKNDFQGNLKINIVFGFSSKGSDIDNPLKPFLDCLQKKYGVNDNQIYELHVKKEIVKKGYEFINFEITNLN